MDHWFLGVDAGGSQTRAVVWRYDSNEFYEGDDGPGNPWSAGVLPAAEAIGGACAQALALAGKHPHELSAAVLGIAGNGRQGLPAGFVDTVAEWGLPSRHCLLSDLEIAAVAGLGPRVGLHVVAGTGSALMLRYPDGRLEQLGGWGWFLGDEGSAFDLGRRALQWWAAVSDGVAVETAFLETLRGACGADHIVELSEKLRNPAESRAWIARLAVTVRESAEEGEPTAGKLWKSALEPLIDHSTAALERLEGGRNLSFSGGLATASWFVRSFCQELESRSVGIDSVSVVSNPVNGALRRAEEIVKLTPSAILKSVTMSAHA